MRIKPRLWFLSLSLNPGLQAASGQEDLLPQGKKIFENRCAEGHRLNGQGLPGTYPALNGDPLVNGDRRGVIATVLNGRKGQLGEMPTWKARLHATEIAATVTYIRNSWSNRAAGVTPAMVAEIRGKDK
jgi:cytochrome c oxidase subunit II